MKTLFPVFVALQFLASIPGNAQLIKRCGLKVAFTSASQDFKYSTFAPDTKRRPGFNAGIYIEWFDLPLVSLITQIEYAQRGMGLEFVRTLNDPTPIEIFTEYNRVDYLSLPVLVKVAVPTTIVTPFLLIGPRIDFFLGYHSDRDLFNAVYDQFKKTMIGGSIGIGVEATSLLPVNVIVEGRYNFDLADSYSTQYLTVRNNSFDVWLGVAL